MFIFLLVMMMSDDIVYVVFLFIYVYDDIIFMNYVYILYMCVFMYFFV